MADRAFNSLCWIITPLAHICCRYIIMHSLHNLLLLIPDSLNSIWCHCRCDFMVKLRECCCQYLLPHYGCIPTNAVAFHFHWNSRFYCEWKSSMGYFWKKAESRHQFVPFCACRFHSDATLKSKNACILKISSSNTRMPYNTLAGCLTAFSHVTSWLNLNLASSFLPINPVGSSPERCCTSRK